MSKFFLRDRSFGIRFRLYSSKQTQKVDRSLVALSKQNFALVTKGLEETNPVLAAGVYPKMTQAIQELACASQLSTIIFSVSLSVVALALYVYTSPRKSNLKNEKYRKVFSLFEYVLASY